MKIFQKLFGRRVDKIGLIRELVTSRVRNDSMAAALGIDEKAIVAMPDIVVLGLPEATIVSIVETWSALKNRGVPDDQVVQFIETQRSPAGIGILPPDFSHLDIYVLYRLGLEHLEGAPLEGDFLETAIEKACAAYDVESPFASPQARSSTVHPASKERLSQPESHGVPYSPSMPDIAGRNSLRTLRLGDFIATVYSRPPPVARRQNPGLLFIDYLYAMKVAHVSVPDVALLYVVAETGGSRPLVLPDDKGIPIQASGVFLCIFDCTGAHINLGAFTDIDELDGFASRALLIAREKLKIQARQ